MAFLPPPENDLVFLSSGFSTWPERTGTQVLWYWMWVSPVVLKLPCQILAPRPGFWMRTLEEVEQVLLQHSYGWKVLSWSQYVWENHFAFCVDSHWLVPEHFICERYCAQHQGHERADETKSFLSREMIGISGGMEIVLQITEIAGAKAVVCGGR